jgi:hypothetical protein
MNITKLAAKPQLVQIVIDDEKIVKEYGEPIVLYTWDRQPMEVFLKLADLKKDNISVSQIVGIARDLVLDENGQKVLVDDVTLPTDVLLEAVSKVTDILGK